jgi:hypothetical protein
MFPGMADVAAGVFAKYFNCVYFIFAFIVFTDKAWAVD